jgi:hypothetical protein
MGKSLAINPAPWATDPAYPAGSNPWSGGPTRINPGSAALAAGAAPVTQAPAQVINYQLGTVGDTLSTQALVTYHAALTNWDQALYAPAGSLVPKFLLAVPAPNGAGAILPNRPSTFIISGTAGGSNQGAKASQDLRSFDVTVGVGGFGPLQTLAVDDVGTMFGGLATSVCKSSTDGGQTYGTFTPGLIVSLEAVYYTGTNYVVAAGGSSTTATALGGSWSAPSLYLSNSTAIQIVGNRTNGAAATAIVILVFSNTTGHRIAYQSTNNGTTWTLGQDFGAAPANITYSQAWGLWVVLNTNGELWTSSDGFSWTKRNTAASLNIVPLFGRSAAIGFAITAIVLRTSGGGFNNQIGIAYTFDLGATWYESYFGDLSGASTLHNIIVANGRLYACDDTKVYISGVLETPSAPNYLGS